MVEAVQFEQVKRHALTYSTKGFPQLKYPLWSQERESLAFKFCGVRIAIWPHVTWVHLSASFGHLADPQASYPIPSYISKTSSPHTLHEIVQDLLGRRGFKKRAGDTPHSNVLGPRRLGTL